MLNLYSKVIAILFSETCDWAATNAAQIVVRYGSKILVTRKVDSIQERTATYQAHVPCHKGVHKRSGGDTQGNSNV